jgi:exoribonuclease R
MNGAIHNDLVAAEYISRYEGRIVKVLNRTLNNFVGEYNTDESGNGVIIIDDSRIKMKIIVDPKATSVSMAFEKQRMTMPDDG